MLHSTALSHARSQLVLVDFPPRNAELLAVLMSSSVWLRDDVMEMVSFSGFGTGVTYAFLVDCMR
eukprot:11932053-Ditylum_brightwellii.AAC.1